MSEANCSEAASLSMSHNSAPAVVKPDLPFRLTGSQAKTKRCIEMNVETMAREAGVDHIGFATFTVGDYRRCKAVGCDGCKKRVHFVQVFDSKEANRRVNNLARRFLPSIFRRWVIITERHKSGAVHFHLAVELPFEAREGYDWEAVRKGDYASANPALRALWALLRQRLPKFGFGRSQVEPAKGAESLARYVAKYVEKNLFNRLESDRKKKLVRYGGWKGKHVRPNDWGWCTPGATKWRTKAQTTAWIAKRYTEPEQVAGDLGRHWAFRLTDLSAHVLDPEFLRDLWERDVRAACQASQASKAELEKWERPLTDDEIISSREWHHDNAEEMDAWHAWDNIKTGSVAVEGGS